MTARLIPNEIQYVEFVSNDFARIKDFYSAAFGWKFTDYGDNYTAFAGTYIEGGFAHGTPVQGSVLVILYSDNLEACVSSVTAAGGTITRDTFEFPGGRRFQFQDPDGNELAVWSDR